MKKTELFLGAIFSAIALLTESQVMANEQNVRFVCAESYNSQTKRNLPTTFAWTTRGKIAIIQWKTEIFKGYSPQERCQEVSPRFEEAYRNGSLQFLTNGTMNNRPVICTARQKYGDCDTLLFTLRPEDNALSILDHLNALFKGYAIGAVQHSSGTPQVYYQIDIDRFLATAPVEAE